MAFLFMGKPIKSGSREFIDSKGELGKPKLELETIKREKKINFAYDEKEQTFTISLNEVEGESVIIRRRNAIALAGWIQACTNTE